jgi:hypothetical protein
VVDNKTGTLSEIPRVTQALPRIDERVILVVFAIVLCREANLEKRGFTLQLKSDE